MHTEKEDVSIEYDSEEMESGSLSAREIE